MKEMLRSYGEGVEVVNCYSQYKLWFLDKVACVNVMFLK